MAEFVWKSEAALQVSWAEADSQIEFNIFRSRHSQFEKSQKNVEEQQKNIKFNWFLGSPGTETH